MPKSRQVVNSKKAEKLVENGKILKNALIESFFFVSRSIIFK